MKLMFITLLSVLCLSAQGFDLNDSDKRVAIKRAISSINVSIEPRDIKFEFSEYLLTINGINDIMSDGDQDIDEFNVTFKKNGMDYNLNCDVISGGVTTSSISNLKYTIFKNCTQTNLYSYQVSKINLPLLEWEDNI